MIADAKHFYIERPRLGFDFSFEYDEEKRKTPISNRVDSSITFSEIIDIETRGWIYHPALVVYSLALTPEWEQIRGKNTLNQSTSLQKSTTFLQGYEAELIFLQHKPYTLKIFGERNMGTIKSSFAKRTKREETAFGSTLFLKYNVLPASISYFHRENIDTGFFTSQRKRDEMKLSASNRSQIGYTIFKSSYNEITQIIDTSSENSRMESISITNSLAFSDNDNVLINSAISYDRTIDSFSENKFFSINESLNWRHKKNLRTRYHLKYANRLTDRNSLNTLKRQVILGDFFLSHLLYENLLTTIIADAKQNQTSKDEVVDYKAGINFNYQRSIPWGNISITMGHTYNLFDVNKSSIITNVSDEPVNLTSSYSFLENTDININSIVVTDTAGLRYTEAGNYTLSRTGSMTRIRCISGGQLDIDLDCSTGASVLIDYQYQSGLPFDYSILTQSYGTSLSLWETLNMYYRYDRSQQNFISGIMPEKLTRELSHQAGTELKLKWSRTNLRFEDNQSNTLPFKETVLEEIITLRPRSNMFINFTLGYGKKSFTDLGETKVNYITANIQQIISNRLKLKAEGFHRKSSGLGQDKVDSGFQFVLNWIYKIYDGDITYSYNNGKDKVLQNSMVNNYFLFVIRRAMF